MSGIRSQIAVKLYGRDMEELRDRGAGHRRDDGRGARRGRPANRAAGRYSAGPRDDPPRGGRPLRPGAGRRGRGAGDGLARAAPSRRCSKGSGLSTWWSGSTKRRGNDIDADPLDADQHALGRLARCAGHGGRGRGHDQGPNTINRENVLRRIVVQCNAAGRDLASVVHDIQTAADEQDRARRCKDGYFIEYGGQFEAQQEANLRLLVLGALRHRRHLPAACYKCLGSWRAALQVMVNIPLAAIGSVIALLLLNWPTAEALVAGAVVAVATGLAPGHEPVGRPLGRLHHADRHRLPQRHHDDFALHPPDEVTRARSSTRR